MFSWPEKFSRQKMINDKTLGKQTEIFFHKFFFSASQSIFADKLCESPVLEPNHPLKTTQEEFSKKKLLYEFGRNILCLLHSNRLSLFTLQNSFLVQESKIYLQKVSIYAEKKS